MGPFGEGLAVQAGEPFSGSPRVRVEARVDSLCPSSQHWEVDIGSCLKITVLSV